MENMILIDAYYIPLEEAAEYVALRDQVAGVIAQAWTEMGWQAARHWQGSQDGEAVCAYDENDDLQAAVHLDPMTVNDWRDYLTVARGDVEQAAARYRADLKADFTRNE